MSARLSKLHKDLFIVAVLADVPAIDYDEQMRQLIQEEAIATLPEKARAVYDDEKTRHFLANTYVYAFGANVSVLHKGYQVSKALGKKLEALNAAKDAQEQQQKELRQQLHVAIDQCNTVKQAHERLPEFIKYLPSLDEATPNLPAVDNVVAALTKAGWPKGSAQPC